MAASSKKRCSVTTVTGEPLFSPEDAASVSLVEQLTADPRVSMLHVTGTAVCGPAVQLRHTHKRRKLTEAALAVGSAGNGGPIEIPWPVTSFKDDFPWNQVVRRHCFNGQVAKAVNHYFSAHTTTPPRTEVVRYLTGAVRSITRSDVTTFESPRWTPALCFLIRFALTYNIKVRMPTEISFVVTDACYTALIGHMLQLSYDRIAAYAANDGGPGWPETFKPATTGGTAARQIATESGLLSTLSASRKSTMWNALQPGKKVYNMHKNGCYTSNRDAGADCVQCPVPLHKRRVCGAETGDTPAAVWANHAVASGQITVNSLVASVPPCMASFPYIKWPNDARRFDVTNTVNEVAAML
jgi:hypothetical protein